MIYRLNGHRVSRKEFMENKKGIDFSQGIVMSQRSGTWPLHSDAAGVHPIQVQEAYEQSVKMGVPTRFDKEGCAIFESRGHRKEYLRKIGLYDRDAAYGDPGPTY